jgi:hypothetical protein
MRYADAKHEFDRRYWHRMLHKHGSVRAAAIAAGQSRQNVSKVINSLGMRSPVSAKYRKDLTLVAPTPTTAEESNAKSRPTCAGLR